MIHDYTQPCMGRSIQCMHRRTGNNTSTFLGHGTGIATGDQIDFKVNAPSGTRVYHFDVRSIGYLDDPSDMFQAELFPVEDVTAQYK